MHMINEKRLANTLEAFRQFGATKKGGVTRLSLSKEDVAARDYFETCCKALNMDVTYDDMGNMYGTLPGKQNVAPIVLGSHIDSVKKGGAYDGILGVVAALEVARTIVESDIALDVPLTIMNFTNEEGARFDPAMMSSGVLTNKFDKETMYAVKDEEGISFYEALAASGYLGDEANRLTEASAYLELHIEQGPVLESLQKEIGVVEGVLGMACYEITIEGESDHAGTTPMSMRKDALFTATDLIQKIRHYLDGLADDNLVYTMGRMHVLPNIHTVIPNKATFTLEARHQDPKKIQLLHTFLTKLPTEMNGCTVRFEKLWGRDTVVFDKAICEAVAQSAEQLSYSAHHMYSGAGHDAQFMASIAPSAMIFVPSLNGKSHCEEEYTSYEDCAKGTNVLLQAVLKMQKQIIQQLTIEGV